VETESTLVYTHTRITVYENHIYSKLHKYLPAKAFHSPFSLFLSLSPQYVFHAGLLFNKIYDGATAVAAAITTEPFLFLYQPLLFDCIYICMYLYIYTIVVGGGGGNLISHARALLSTYNKRRRAHTDTKSDID